MKQSLIEKALMKRSGKAPAVPEPSAETAAPEGDGTFEEIVAAFEALIRSGELPDGFDLEAACADEAFAALLAKFEPEAAICIYSAEKRAEEAEANAMKTVSERMRSRAALPKSQRGGAAADPKPDYKSMSSEAFRALLSDMKHAARNGGKTRL